MRLHKCDPPVCEDGDIEPEFIQVHATTSNQPMQTTSVRVLTPVTNTAHSSQAIPRALLCVLNPTQTDPMTPEESPQMQHRAGIVIYEHAAKPTRPGPGKCKSTPRNQTRWHSTAFTLANTAYYAWK